MENEIVKNETSAETVVIEAEAGGIIESFEISAVGRSPEVIAAEINMIKSQTAAVIQTLGGHIRSGVYEIGRLLCEAKERVPHGEWGTWLAENVEYSDSTAQNLMRIYRELSDGQVDMLTGKTQAELFAGLDYSQMLEVLKLPKSERARLAEENDLSGMSAREVKALVKEKKELEKKLSEKNGEISELISEKESAEKEAAEHKATAERAEKARSEAEKAAKTAEKVGKAQLKELQKELDELKKAPPAAEVSAEDIERIKAEAVSEVEKKHKAELEQIRFDGERRSKEIKAEAEAEANKRIEELKAKYAAANDDTVKVVSVYIDELNDILSKISDKVDTASPEVASKLKGALSRLLSTAAEGFAEVSE